uniref:Uncharacterized protein n=1 Tax=Ceratitis capitata TaxID=7213 RepID=W8BX48_CERCA
MAQRNNARIDRFAQMTKQEEIIAKKRQEILEKQRTAQLAKAVAAAQSLAAKLKSDVNEAETSGGDTAIGVDNKSVESSSSIANADSVIPNELAAAIDKSDACVKGKKEDSSESAIAKPLNSLTGKTGKISFGLKRLHTQVPVAEQPPPKVVNSFCNDGSFLENFKKILEKHEPKPTQTTLTPELKADDLATEPASVTQANESAAEEDSQKQNETSVELNQGQLPMGQTAAPSVPPISQSGIQQTLQHPIMTSMSQPSMPHHQHPHQLQQSMAPSPQQHMRAFPPPQPAQHPSLSSLQPQVQPPIQHQVQQANILPPTQPPFLFNHHPPQPPPVPPPHPMSAAFFAAAPPPPPPPQLPMTLALGPLYMIPAPEPLQLNTIPAPKEFDLNAIPKPQMNVEAIQMPHGVQQSHQQVLQVQQQIQQQQQQQQRPRRNYRRGGGPPAGPGGRGGRGRRFNNYYPRNQGRRSGGSESGMNEGGNDQNADSTQRGGDGQGMSGRRGGTRRFVRRNFNNGGGRRGPREDGNGGQGPPRNNRPRRNRKSSGAGGAPGGEGQHQQPQQVN